MTLQDKINYSIDLIRKAEKIALEFHPEYGHKFKKVDDIFEWWVSKKSQDKFVADNYLQQKIQFNHERV